MPMHRAIWRGSAAALGLLWLGAVAWADAVAHPPSDALAAYVARPDPSYTWRVRSQGRVGRSSYVELIMSSQTWRDTLWQHQLYIIHPSTRDPASKHALLFISGGKWKPELEGLATEGRLPRNSEVFVELTEKLRAPVAILRQVPYQPLFDGLTEDSLIALTFDRFLETGDQEWPLLLPMVKSAVRAMDTVQAYALTEWGTEIESFTVTGASKRGWTTWLTGAVDSRVAAIAPMVIDVVNMAEQMQHARASWGQPSDKIRPYTERHLHERLDSPGGRSLMQIVDPYSYRQVLRQPKVIINGTNDEYWPLDALNLYWSVLEGEKRVLYVPNNGHGLKDYKRIIGSLVALHRHVAYGDPLPVLQWQFEEARDSIRLELRASPRPERAAAWIARSPTRDFREARWESTMLKRRHGRYSIEVERPRSGYVAVLGEGVFSGKRTVRSHFSTTVQIFDAEATAPAATTSPVR